MKTKLVLMFTGLALALGLGLARRERGRAVDATQARTRMEQSSAAARAARQRLDEKLSLAQRDLEARQRELAQLKRVPSTTVASGAEPPSASVARRADPFERVIRSDPKLQALRLAAERARLATDFEALFRERGLTPGQIARFQGIVCAREEALADIAATVQSLNLDEEDPRIAQVRGVASEAARTALQDLLGPEGFRRMEECKATISLRNSVRGFAAAALDAGFPLSSGQADQLAAAVISTGHKSSHGGWVLPNWSAVDALAPGFLTAEQFALFQRVEAGSGRFWNNLQESVDTARRADAPTAHALSPNSPGR